MKTVIVTFVVPDDEHQLNAELEESGVLNNHPVFGWDVRDSTQEEENFLAQYEREYL